MAPHSSTLAWEIPWTEEPGRLQSMGSLGVGHDWATSLSLFTFMHWRRKWQPTPMFLPGESQRQRSLVGCRLWGRTESDTTKATEQQHQRPQEYKHNVDFPTNCLKKKVGGSFLSVSSIHFYNTLGVGQAYTFTLYKDMLTWKGNKWYEQGYN